MEMPDCVICNHKVVCRWFYDYGEPFRTMADDCPFYESSESCRETEVKK